MTVVDIFFFSQKLPTPPTTFDGPISMMDGTFFFKLISASNHIQGRRVKSMDWFWTKKKSKPCPRSGPPSWKFENEIRRRPFEQTTPSTRRREQLKFAFFLRVFAQPYRHWRLVFLSFFSRYFKATSRGFIRRSQREQHPRPVGENRSGTDASSWTLTGRAHTWKPMRRRRKMAALIAGSVFTLRPTRQSTDEAFTFLFSTQKKSLRQSNQAPHHHVTLAILH